jgi:hypothetical protein
MTLKEYQEQVAQIPFGKLLPTASYVYWAENADFGNELNRLIAALAARHALGSEFNVIKFRTGELKISFLSYPDFMETAHPSLQRAITVDLGTGRARHTSYTDNLNPPILHRKESLLPKAHPRQEEFAALTRAEEAAGLYEHTATIGFKLNWERLLAEKGVAIVGHTLQQNEVEKQTSFGPSPFVERHKTALIRYELSKPVKGLLEYGLLQSEITFFDYGCGQGGDVKGLQGLGYHADGWDPVFRPDAPKLEADIVNLGYIINVIEDPAERLDVLIDSYRHAKRLLVVSAVINEHLDTDRAERYRDGVLTKRKTFQKFYDQQELQQFIEDALETTAVPVGLGVFYVFRIPVEQQDFLSARSRRAIDWTQISSRLGLGGPPADRWEALYAEHKELLDGFGGIAMSLGRLPDEGEFGRASEVEEKLGSLRRGLRAYVQGGRAVDLDWSEIAVKFGIGLPKRLHWELLCEENKDLLEDFWKFAIELGRMPTPEEFARHDELIDAVGSAKRGMTLLEKKGGGDAFRRAAESRRNELLVYVGLANLRKKVPFGHLSRRLKQDVREFFGNYTKALQKGLELLYAAGDEGEIELACENLKLGWQDEQALYFHRSLLDDLPPILRAYVGCATALFGDVAQADVIKLHKSSGKVTFLIYDDFEGKPLPELRQRIKVNLRTQSVQAFDHSSEGQLLCYKEKLVAPTHPGRHEMESFSQKLEKLGLNIGFLRLTKRELGSLLESRGLDENLNQIR